MKSGSKGVLVAVALCGALGHVVACSTNGADEPPSIPSPPAVASLPASPCAPCAPKVLYEAMLGPFGDGGSDIDGDGLADIVISNRNLHSDPRDNGRVNSISAVSPKSGGVIRQWSGGPGFGYRVAMAGDLDADGRGDVLASQGDTARSLDARLTAISGQSGDVEFDISGMAIADDIAALGDLDGDGHDDFGFTTGCLRPMPPGVTYWQEGAFGFEAHSGKDGRLLVEHSAPGTNYLASYQGLRGFGDLDLDGTPDVLAAEPGDAIDGRSQTRVVVVSGGTGEVLADLGAEYVSNESHESIDAAGDIDGDGWPDAILGSERGTAHIVSPHDGRVLFEFKGVGGDAFGWSVAGLGDANGDQIPEVAVGAPLFETYYDGLAYVRIISGADGTDLAQVLGSREMDGIFDRANIFGICIRAAGDVDGDGRNDVLIGEDRGFGFTETVPDRLVVVGLAQG